MLDQNPLSRPTIKKVQNTLREIKEGKHTEPIKPIVKVGLRGKGIAPDSKTPITPPEYKTGKEPIPIHEEEPTKKVGLRGKGLNIKG